MTDKPKEHDARDVESGSVAALFLGTWHYARRYRAVICVLAAGLCFETLYDVAVRYALKYVVDLAVVGRDLGALVAVLCMLGGGAILFHFVVIGCDYIWAKTGGKIMNDIRSDMFDRLQALPMSFHDRQSTGNLAARFNADMALIDTGMVLGFPMAAMGVVEVVATIVLMWLVHPLLCGIAVVGIAASLLVPLLVQRRAVNASFAQRESEGRMAGELTEKLRGHATIKAFGLEERASDSFRDRLEDLQKRRVRADFLSYLVSRIPSLFFLLLLLLVLAVGGWLAIRGDITLGELVAYQALLIGLNSAIYNLTWTLPSFVEAAASWRRIREVLDEPLTIADKAGALPLEKISGSIELRNVSFSYPSSASLALDGVDIAIGAGEYAAIVGPSGAGKSSLINLLMRFYEVSDGCLLVENRDIREATLQSLRGQIGLVSQDVMLFDASVRENIAMGKGGASEEEIVAAAKAAEIHSRIVALPEGYDTRLGPDGSRLSGGERQRIALARALVRKPAILALDEFSSSLDRVTEAGILRTIETLKGSCTILSVTHRRSVAEAAETVYVLRGGRVVESGRPAELATSGNEYSRLWADSNGEQPPPGSAKS